MEEQKSLRSWYAALSPSARLGWALGLGLGVLGVLAAPVLVLLVVIIFAASGSPAPLPGPQGYHTWPMSRPYAPPVGGSPADRWLNGNEFGGRLSSGTIDRSGQGNHVISVDGKVLNLP